MTSWFSSAMNNVYLFTVNKSNRLLASRKENKQVNKVLSEMLPFESSLSCSQNQFEEFRDVMYAIGFVIENIETNRVKSKEVDADVVNSDLV